MKKRVALVPGEAQGAELREAASIVRALQLPVDLVPLGATEARALAPDSGYDALLLGAAAGAPLLGALRRALGLYLHCRPVRLLDERLCPLRDKRAVDVDFVLFSENAEAGEPEGLAKTGLAALEYARRPARRRRLWLLDEAATLTAALGQGDSGVRILESSSAAAARQLVRAPEKLDVLVGPSATRSLLGDLGAEVAGGLGLSFSADLHPGRCSLFAPAARDATGARSAQDPNPVGAMLAAALMLEHLGFAREAARIDAAVRRTLGEDILTPDLGGSATTAELGEFVRRHL